MGRYALKGLTVIGALAFVCAIGYDAVVEEPQESLQTQVTSPLPCEVNGELSVTGIRYDLQSHSVSGTVNLYVKRKNDKDIDSVALSIADTGIREWRAASNKEGPLQRATQQENGCKLQLSEEDEGEKRVSAATLECKNVEMLGGSGANEIWYPFDSYRISTSPQACINSSTGACYTGSKGVGVSIKSLTFTIADPNLKGELSVDPAHPGVYHLILKRRSFTHLVSIIFLGFSIIFLIYLGFSGDRNDLLPKSLGFFGALWALRALIVPASVTIFPTSVDFAIFTIFGLLFLLVAFRLLKGGQQ